MEPIDLLIGGESELRTRVRSYVLAEWQKVTNSLSGTLGDLPDSDLAGFLNQTRPLVIDLAYTGSGGPSASSLIAALAPLGNVVARSRPLTPADLNAASDVAEDGWTPRRIRRGTRRGSLRCAAVPRRFRRRSETCSPLSRRMPTPPPFRRARSAAVTRSVKRRDA